MLEQKVREILRSREVVHALPQSNVKEAAKKMAQSHVGAIVVEADNQLFGIFTERDMVERVVIPGLSPSATPLKDVMTPDPDVVGPGDTLISAMLAMKQHKSRYAVVRDGSKVIGIISIVDILRAAIDHTYDEAHQFDHVWEGVPI